MWYNKLKRTSPISHIKVCFQGTTTAFGEKSCLKPFVSSEGAARRVMNQIFETLEAIC